MEQSIAKGVLSLLTLTSITFTPISQTATPASTIKQETSTVVHVVKRGETLQSIAQAYYDDEGFWTNIWNANANIQNPSIIEVGTKLSIKTASTPQKEPLDKESLQKIESIQRRSKKATLVASSTNETAQQASEVPVQASPAVLTEEQLNYLGSCESGMTATRNSGNGYYGAFQFSQGTWNNMNTGYERADLAPLEVQKEAVQRLLSRSSIYTQFPGCAQKMQSLSMI